VQKASSDLRTVLGEPELQQKFAMQGTFVHPMSGAELAAFVRSEQQMWKPIVRRAGLGPR
jgi:tripartite-type tricarboxylate transporter receptor subunit TctC